MLVRRLKAFLRNRTNAVHAINIQFPYENSSPPEDRGTIGLVVSKDSYQVVQFVDLAEELLLDFQKLAVFIIDITS